MAWGGLPWNWSSPNFVFCTRRCRGDQWGHGWCNFCSLLSPPPAPRGTGRQRLRQWFWHPHWGRRFWSTTLSREHLGRILVQVVRRWLRDHWYLWLFYLRGWGQFLLLHRWWCGRGPSSSDQAGGSHVGLSMQWCIRQHRLLKVVLRGGRNFWCWDDCGGTPHFFHNDGADGIRDGGRGGSAGHSVLFAFTCYQLPLLRISLLIGSCYNMVIKLWSLLYHTSDYLPCMCCQKYCWMLMWWVTKCDSFHHFNFSPLHNYTIAPLHHSKYTCYQALPLMGFTVPKYCEYLLLYGECLAQIHPLWNFWHPRKGKKDRN